MQTESTTTLARMPVHVSPKDMTYSLDIDHYPTDLRNGLALNNTDNAASPRTGLYENPVSGGHTSLPLSPSLSASSRFLDPSETSGLSASSPRLNPTANENELSGYSPSRYDGFKTNIKTNSGRSTPSSTLSLPFTPTGNERRIFDQRTTNRSPIPNSYSVFGTPIFNGGQVNATTGAGGHASPPFFLQEGTLVTSSPTADQFPLGVTDRFNVHLSSDLLDGAGSGLQLDNAQAHFELLDAAAGWFGDHNVLDFNDPSIHSLEDFHPPTVPQFQDQGTTINNHGPNHHPQLVHRRNDKNAERDSLDAQPVFFCAVPGCGHKIRRHDNVVNHYRSAHPDRLNDLRCRYPRCRAGYVCIAHPGPSPARGRKVPHLSNEEINDAPKICSAAPSKRHHVCRICFAAFETPRMLADHMDTRHPGQ